MINKTNFKLSDIICFNNSQNAAFEELICQLARNDNIENKKEFIRLGAPDAGVEAYCILNDGKEFGWQAKFFDSMKTSQWKQLTKSFKTALEKHPNLIKYYICIPLDRQDPRTPKQKWFMDKWLENVKKWKKYASTKRRVVDFEYWGSSEIIDRLSKPDNAGKLYFWFNKTEFTNEWFIKINERNIENLGDRYTPELNYKIDDLAIIFDGLYKNERFKLHFKKVYTDLSNKYDKLEKNNILDTYPDMMVILKKHINNIKYLYNNINFDEMDLIDPIKFVFEIDEALSTVRKIEIAIKNDKENNKKQDITYKQIFLFSFKKSVFSFKAFINSNVFNLANRPFLILSGGGGTGKSHLFADIILNNQHSGKLSLLLLGQHFNSSDDPWTQILKNQFRLSCSDEEFLGALNSKAQYIGSRIILFIDAIDDGQGIYFWKEHIKGFIKSFEKYNWLGLALSLRTTYEESLIPEGLFKDNKITRIEHHGFEYEYDKAIKLFFNHYNIIEPSTPIMDPEFQNPLFLKLFCEALSKSGLKAIPEGYDGITAIFTYYINSINKKIALPQKFNFDSAINIALKSAQIIAQKILQNGNNIPCSEAHSILEIELQHYLSKKGILKELISEGLFTKDLSWDSKEKKYYDSIRFTYQRLKDHVIADMLIQNSNSLFSGVNISEADQISKLFDNPDLLHINKGLIEALSIKIPEITGKELYEYFPAFKNNPIIVTSFIDSLLWRNTNTLSSKLIPYINEVICSSNQWHNHFMNTIILMTSKTNHFFNADFLHRNLHNKNIANRDASWTIFLHDSLEQNSPIKRLIDWAWNNDSKTNISSASILLMATTISWFFTSTNRELRDCATKSLIRLINGRIELLIQLLEKFNNVNDPYVYERLFAVSYGCALCNSDKEKLKTLSEYIYNSIFSKELIYPHVLLRDYARNIIEYALYLNIDLNIEKEKIKPPYKSEPISSFPTDKDVKKFELDTKIKKFYYSQNIIIDSMTTEYTRDKNVAAYGDFGRYTFQSSFRNWAELNPIDLSNWVIKKIFEIGYDVNKHGQFDYYVFQNQNQILNRHNSKIERIGKKYQWLAFHELLARVSDHFTHFEDVYSKPLIPQKYEGPWEPYVRDIDPTFVTNTLQDNIQKDNVDNNFIIEISRENWELENSKWLKIIDDMPCPKNIILRKDKNNTEWLNLESYLSWTDPMIAEKDMMCYPHKRIWYQIRSYLVKQEEFIKILTWAKNKNFYGRWMPESNDKYQIFNREYYWSAPYNYFKKNNYDWVEWHPAQSNEEEKPAGKFMISSESYYWEKLNDYSKDGRIKFLRPCENIFKGMNLLYSYNEAEFCNDKNEKICFDPSFSFSTPSMLLVRKIDFINYLSKNNLNVFWTLLGEKQIFGSDNTDHSTPNHNSISATYHLDSEMFQIIGGLNTKNKK